MKKFAKPLFLIPMTVMSFVLVFFAFSSCARDEYGRKELEKIMFSDYTAEIDYVIDFDGNPMSGSATVTKDGCIRLDIHSPDPYSGMSVESDTANKADMISISYSGVKSEIPKTALEKIVFINGMFSDAAATAVKKADKKSFSACAEQYVSETAPKAVPYECKFSQDGTNYIYIYDKESGTPLELFAENGRCKAEVKVKSIVITD